MEKRSTNRRGTLGRDETPGAGEQAAEGGREAGGEVEEAGLEVEVVLMSEEGEGEVGCEARVGGAHVADGEGVPEPEDEGVAGGKDGGGGDGDEETQQPEEEQGRDG